MKFLSIELINSRIAQQGIQKILLSALYCYIWKQKCMCVTAEQIQLYKNMKKIEIERETLYQNETLDKKGPLLFISLETTILLYYFE